MIHPPLMLNKYSHCISSGMEVFRSVGNIKLKWIKLRYPLYGHVSPLNAHVEGIFHIQPRASQGVIRPIRLAAAGMEPTFCGTQHGSRVSLEHWPRAWEKCQWQSHGKGQGLGLSWGRSDGRWLTDRIVINEVHVDVCGVCVCVCVVCVCMCEQDSVVYGWIKYGIMLSIYQFHCVHFWQKWRQTRRQPHQQMIYPACIKMTYRSRTSFTYSIWIRLTFCCTGMVLAHDKFGYDALTLNRSEHVAVCHGYGTQQAPKLAKLVTLDRCQTTGQNCKSNAVPANVQKPPATAKQK